MKNNITILLFIIGGVLANAQGRRADQSAVNIEYGYIANNEDVEGGFMLKGGYSKVIGKKGFLGKIEAFYQNYEVTYIDNQILPYQKYGLNANAGYSIEALAPVYFNAWIGGFAGYEMANDGKKTDPKYNAEIPTEVKGFVYGLSGSAEIEYAFARKFSMLTNYTQFYDLKSKFSKSNFGFFAGIKYYIN